MCGIIGIINKNNSVDPQSFKTLTQSLEHRGPDAVDIYVHQNLGLGHTRLKIIDLSNHGNQPMISQCGNYVLIYNGEIYNYLELRQELSATGYKFQTQSDTEVLLAAYLTWGKSACEKLNGMWAFVIFDKQKNTLFGSRDRFGIKPLYYATNTNGFYFSSEIKPLLKIGIPSNPNLEAVQYFILTGIMDHADHTFFQNVHRIDPGCNFEYDITRHTLKTYRYYEFNTKEQSHSLDEFKALFTDSVRIRMRSDVEVGTCLSGGMDSSSVASIASEFLKENNANSRLTAFTAVSTDPRNDESAYARAVAEKHGMRSIHSKPTYEDFVQYLPEIVRTQEEPFGGPSIIMQYLLMKKVKETGVLVLLDGQGGDELLLGYSRYSAAYLFQIFKKHGLVSMFRHAKEYVNQNHGQTLPSIAKYFIASHNAKLRFARNQNLLSFLKHKLPVPEYLLAYAQSAKTPSLLQIIECTRTNLPSLLRFEDKNSMAFGIEARLPFLDHRLAEYAISLPLDYKIREGWTKWVLRKSMEEHLPHHITWRKNKMGFEAPKKSWVSLYQSEMRDCVLRSKLLQQLCSMEQLKKDYFNLDVNAKWRLFSVAMWERVLNVA